MRIYMSFNSIDEIDARIAELEQRIADKEAYQRDYHPNRMGALWDAITGNPGYLQALDNAHAAYQNMLRQQEQETKMKKATREANLEDLEHQSREKYYDRQQQARENLLNRQNALDIALMNRNDSSEDKSDEYMKQFQLAENDLEFAKQMLDVSNPESIARFEKALTLRNHYAAKLKDIDLESKPEKYEDSYSVKINKAIAKIKALGRQKKWNDEERDEYDKLMKIVPITDERRAELESIRKDKPATPEDKDRELAAAIASFKKTGKNPDPKKYKAKLKDNKPYTLIRK